MEWKFRSKDHLEMFARLWTADHCLGTVIIVVHGIGEHSGRYESLGKDLNVAGICLAAFDQRGHGRSGGPRGHTPSMSAWLDDITSFIQQVKVRVKTERIILYGHSMGGLEVLNYILKHPEGIEGAIVTSPSLRLMRQPSGWKKVLGKWANRWMPEMALSTELKSDDLTHSAAIIGAYKTDPLVHDRITARTYACINEGSDWAFSNAKSLSVPLLIMHGDQDMIASPAASAEFAKLSPKFTEFVMWKGYRHELHNEINRQPVIEKMHEWCHILSTKGRTL